MELRHLRYFVAVAEERSFRRAATRLAMAQPPLSQQIHQLEAEIGATLFDRKPRVVRLTAAGRLFLEDAYTILAQTDRAIARAQRAGRGDLGQITVGYTSLIHYPFFSEVLRRYHERYPDVTLVLRDLVTIDQMQQLETNTLDVSIAAYAALALAATQSRLQSEPLLREPLVAALPKRHHLAHTSAPLPLHALANESWIWFARLYDPTTYDYMMQLFEQAGFQPRVTQEVNQQNIFIDLVAAGLGVSLVPTSIQRVARDDIVYRDVVEPTPIVEFQIVWRRDEQSSLVQAFLSISPGRLSRRHRFCHENVGPARAICIGHNADDRKATFLVELVGVAA